MRKQLIPVAEAVIVATVAFLLFYFWRPALADAWWWAKWLVFGLCVVDGLRLARSLRFRPLTPGPSLRRLIQPKSARRLAR